MHTQTEDSQTIVLFDGVCILCDRSVRFVIDHDAKNSLKFVALQSDMAATLLSHHGRAPAKDQPPDSIVLIENGQIFESSTAALRIARHLRGGWKLLYALIIVPRPIRDALYRWIARNRYRWFGTQEVCMLPPSRTSRS